MYKEDCIIVFGEVGDRSNGFYSNKFISFLRLLFVRRLWGKLVKMRNIFFKEFVRGL